MLLIRADDESSTRDGLAPAKERSKLSLFIDQQEKKCPRTFNIVFYSLIPLLLLISWAILCGHLLALLEKDIELEANDQAIAAFERGNDRIDEATRIISQTFENCMEEVLIGYSSDSIFTYQDVRKLMTNCTNQVTDEMEKTADTEKNDNMIELVTEKLSFNWNTCWNQSWMDYNNPVPAYNQGLASWTAWRANRADLNETYSGNQTDGAYEKATNESSAREICRINSAAGSNFWFTIMTTIGYGNTAPVSDGGRILVATLGFVSILAFTFVSGAVGHVTLAIVDDFFLRCKYKRFSLERLTKGWSAVLFWFGMVFVSLFAVAGIKQKWQHDRKRMVETIFEQLTENTTIQETMNINMEAFERFQRTLLDNFQDITLNEGLWFAFVSITTVGFGDYYISHDMYEQSDMFYIPLMMLSGFVCLANFLMKLTDVSGEMVFKTGLFDDESIGDLLLQSRMKNSKRPQSIELESTVTTEKRSDSKDDVFIDNENPK